MKFYYLILTVLALTSCNNFKEPIPNVDIVYTDKYHCWPYDVEIYSVKNVKIDSTFFKYPQKDYFGNNSKYIATTWALYKDIDTLLFDGLDITLRECDDNKSLYQGIIKGDKIYYSGIYRLNRNLEGVKKRVYDEILFLDLKNNKLHIFKDINKVY